MSVDLQPQLVDETARREAAGRLERNVVVSAGAGTGKTRLLIDRLTLLIVGREMPVDKLVALTFTKKAAEEMRDRLERRLRDIIADPDALPLLNELYPTNRDRRARLAARALDDIPKAQIGTIHSFAGHLLRLYPVQAGVDPAFREDDGTAFETIFEKEWRNWLADELSSGSPREKAWRAWLAAIDLSDLRAAAWALSENESALERLSHPEDPAPLMHVSAETIDRLVTENGVPKRSKVFAPRLEAMRRVFAAVGAGKKPSPLDIDQVARLTVPPEWKERAEAASDLKTLQKRALAAASIDEKLVGAVVAAVTPFVRRFRRELSRRGVLTFDDLLLKSRNLLRDHTAVRAALKAHFQTFLVDEFQDTDPLQGEILFYLAEAPGAEAKDWRQATLAEGRLFVVGDPKQSIYRFRGADIAAFEEFWKRMVNQGALEASLTCNFRSERHIIDAVNAIFSRIMVHEPYIQPAYQALDCGFRGEGGPACEIAVVESGDEDPKAHVQRVFEGELVAGRIAKDVGQVVNGRPLAYRDFAILIRGTNAFAPYLDALRERGIPFLAEGEKTYFHRPEILELSNLLAFLCDPADTLALAGVLRSPLGGLTDAEVLELKLADSLHVRRPPKILKDKIGTLYETLSRLLETAHARPVPDVIRGLFDASGLVDLAAGRRHGEQAVANLRKAAQLAEKWIGAEPLTLRNFVERLRLYRDESRDEGENPLADVQYDAVRVMTIHKVKGLEFRCVFLPNLSAASGRATADPDVVVQDWRSESAGLRLPGARVMNASRLLIDEEIRRRETAEELRVFYVAATRAKERLLLIVRRPTRAGAPYADFLIRAAAWPGEGVSTVSPDGVDIAVSPFPWKALVRRRGENPIVLSGDWTPAPLAKNLSSRFAERKRCRGERLIVTPTSRLRANHPPEAEKRPLLDDEIELDRTPAIMIGHICHSVLEGWDFKPATKASAGRLKSAVALAARFHGLLEESDGRDAVLAEAEKILTGFVSSDTYRRLGGISVQGRELPFFYPLGSGDAPKLMRGVMDLVYRDAGGIVVADYKTNRVDDATIDEVAESYRPQGEIYVKAIEKITGEKAAFELLFLRTGESRRLPI